VLLVAASLVAACGSTATPAPLTTATTVPTTADICAKVGAALSSGPDPTTDPVGYALAQLIPLRQITGSASGTLATALGDLAEAYQEYVASKGKSGVDKAAVIHAAARVNSLCPGVEAAA
jgi:hypothetical protein